MRLTRAACRLLSNNMRMARAAGLIRKRRLNQRLHRHSQISRGPAMSRRLSRHGRLGTTRINQGQAMAMGKAILNKAPAMCRHHSRPRRPGTTTLNPGTAMAMAIPSKDQAMRRHRRLRQAQGRITIAIGTTAAGGSGSAAGSIPITGPMRTRTLIRARRIQRLRTTLTAMIRTPMTAVPIRTPIRRVMGAV
jgi:hypothetical protein